MEVPNLRHSPESLIEIIQAYIQRELSTTEIKAKERAVRDRAEHKLRHLLKGEPWKRMLLSKLLNMLRAYIRGRENSRYCRSELFGVCKNIFRAIGHCFATDGVVESKEDIFHLSIDEIFGYIDGTGFTKNLQALVALRKTEIAEYQKVETPMAMTTLGEVQKNQLTVKSAEQHREMSELQGLGSSTGKVQGFARRVIDPTQVSNIGEGAILVARETDPGWLFLMLQSKGIVVERGSMLSHTAITGRKFGIPTVVAVDGATTRIPDGAWIEIDGASGLVKILEHPEDARRAAQGGE